MSQKYGIINNEVHYFTADELRQYEADLEREKTIVAPKRVRENRNLLLAATDWTQAADVPQALKDKWAPYRQALRDVPQQPGFPENIQWPAKPE